jgi:poly(3-hydroxyalkanoate) synthetase
MKTQQLDTLVKAVTLLDDQWLIFAERSAFMGEAYARLLSGHPHLPKEVTHGGEHMVRQLRQEAQQIGKQLSNTHQRIKEYRAMIRVTNQG